MVKHCMAAAAMWFAMTAAFPVYAQPKENTLGSLWPGVEKNYPGIGAKMSAVDAARFHEQSVKGNRLPQVKAQAQSTYGTYEGSAGAFFPQAGFFNVSGPAVPLGGSAMAASSFGSAVAEWELFSFGKLRNENEAANALYQKTVTGQAQKSASLPSLRLLGGYSCRGTGIAPDGTVSGAWPDGFSNTTHNFLGGTGITWNITGLHTSRLKADALYKEAESSRFLRAQYGQAMQAGLSASQVKIRRQYESPQRSVNEIQTLVLTRIRPMFVEIPGITAPAPFGGNVRSIVVNVDPEAMQANGLSPDDITAAITRNSLPSPAGNIRIGDENL